MASDETPIKTNGSGPVTVGDPADAASFAIPQKHLEEYVKDTEAKSAVVECRRPPKGIFFTVRPETNDGIETWQNRGFFFLLELEGRDPHIVTPAIADAKKEEDVIRPVMIVRYVTMAGEEGLWALKLNPPEGKSNRWNTSAMNVLHIAEGEGGKWVRLISKREYLYQVSKKTLKETPPKFTDRSFIDLVNSAFKDRLISTLDHEIWDALDNGSTK